MSVELSRMGNLIAYIVAKTFIVAMIAVSTMILDSDLRLVQGDSFQASKV